MDISNLTIPSNLFYSSSTVGTPKPRCLTKLTPMQIAKNMKTKNSDPNVKNWKRPGCKKHKSIKAIRPQLGRIKKTKKIVKTKRVLKENNNNNESVQESTENNIPTSVKPEIKSPERPVTPFRFFKSRNKDTPTHSKTEKTSSDESKDDHYSLLQFDSQEEDDEVQKTTKTIEALLSNLGDSQEQEDHDSRDSEVSGYTLDGLIGTLEGK